MFTRAFALATLLAATSCAHHQKASFGAPSAAMGVTAAPANDPNDPMLQIEAAIAVQAIDVSAAGAHIRTEVAARGGRIVFDEIAGRAGRFSRRSSLTMKVRIPPASLEPLLSFIASEGAVDRRSVRVTDVSKQFFDQALALKNLRLTNDRLQEILKRPGIRVDEVLAIERELTRVRGEIQRLEGAQRFLRDKVTFATLDISIRGKREVEAIASAKAKLWIGPEVALFSIAGRQPAGGGITVELAREGTFELLVAPDGASTLILATFGSAIYSDLLGGGLRSYLNPYLGLRAGYAQIDGKNEFAFGGELGLELVKFKYVEIDAWVRAFGAVNATGLTGLLNGGAAVKVPF